MVYGQKYVSGEHGTGGYDTGYSPDAERGRAGSGRDDVSAPVKIKE